MLTNCRRFSTYKRRKKKTPKFKAFPKDKTFSVSIHLSTLEDGLKLTSKHRLAFPQNFDRSLFELWDESSIAESVLIFYQSKLSWLQAWINIYWTDERCLCLRKILLRLLCLALWLMFRFWTFSSQRGICSASFPVCCVFWLNTDTTWRLFCVDIFIKSIKLISRRTRFRDELEFFDVHQHIPRPTLVSTTI